MITSKNTCHKMMMCITRISQMKKAYSFLLGQNHVSSWRESLITIFPMRHFHGYLPEIEIDDCRITAMRVNYVGELGWELHHELNDQNKIFDKLFENGSDLGLKPFGIRAMDSMRFEKSYRMVGTELSIEYSAFESSMDRFIQTDKENFLGKESLLAWQKKK